MIVNLIVSCKRDFLEDVVWSLNMVYKDEIFIYGYIVYISNLFIFIECLVYFRECL